ncbi:transglycosylase domain-containing protein [Rhodobacteraceae bacterium 2376]|uniref:peptidoglycan glycosyltransferase n=1 Tax=Rhabdonatronobacter sediminivivens TaxID=2743469 RepID=A0A7Z0I168_9RHOB|nr:transglycosylase domain-containing protein [Rhabdonatronobacter sediminivivens]NYS26034.1 transglycosylase domain-containing protein [Rhabdonatronobacter sediminivivens]
MTHRTTTHRHKAGLGKAPPKANTSRNRPPSPPKSPCPRTRHNATSRSPDQRGHRSKTRNRPGDIRTIWQRLRKACRHPWRLLALGMLAAITLGTAGPQLILAAHGWRSDLPRSAEVQQFFEQPTLTLEIQDDGSFPQHCACFLPVDAQDVPAHLRNALLASEDRRFDTHQGIDLIGTLRALRANLAAARVVQGGSTITQQLAKSLTGNQRTRHRKIRELVLARRIEASIDKEEILRLYLDRAYFGRSATGIEAAARAFFSKPARALTLFEGAALVGRLPKPSGRSDQAALEADARRTLDRMVAAEMITRAEATAALAEGPQPGGLPPLSFNIRHYQDWVGRALHKQGLRGRFQVVLALDLRHQMAARGAIADAIAQGHLDADQEVALAAIAPDGRVTALIGGRDYRISQFDRASLARRQPGSTVKPFTFLTALEQGWSPEQFIDDAPILLDGWQPRNHDRLYMGKMTLSEALEHSRNAATVRLAKQVGISEVADLFERFGLPGTPARPAFLLGAEATGVLDVANAYAGLAADGRRIMSTGILGVLAPDGNVVLRRARQPQDQIASPHAVAALNTMLHAAAPWDGFAGKSGTSQKNRDAWFAGFSGQATAVVWVGRDDAGPMPGTFGGGISARIWRQFLEALEPPV